jgi:hypothetical protein
MLRRGDRFLGTHRRSRNAGLGRDLNARFATVATGKADAGRSERDDETAANREDELASPTLSPSFRADRGRVLVDLMGVEGRRKGHIPRLRMLRRVGHIAASSAKS